MQGGIFNFSTLLPPLLPFVLTYFLNTCVSCPLPTGLVLPHLCFSVSTQLNLKVESDFMIHKGKK